MRLWKPKPSTTTYRNDLAHKPAYRWLLFLEYLPLIKAVLLGAAWILVFAGRTLLYANQMREKSSTDIAGASLLADYGTVITKRNMASSGNRYTVNISMHSIAFRLKEHVVTFQAASDTITENVSKAKLWNDTQPGEIVRINYRIGKSGNFYVDSWERLPDKRAEH